MKRFSPANTIKAYLLAMVYAMLALFRWRPMVRVRDLPRGMRRTWYRSLLKGYGLHGMAGAATLVAARSPLYWQSQKGGIPAIIDVSMFTGNVFFVDSAAAAASDTAGYGYSPDRPFATIDFAVGQCTANQGDVIFVLPGHAETINTAGGITCDIAGISIIGLGHGEDRPTVTVGSSADTSTILINAADVQLKNLIVVPGNDGVDVLVAVEADGAILEDLELRSDETNTYQADTYIQVAGGANASDRCTIRRCKVVSVTAGATQAILVTLAQDALVIEDCWVDGDFTAAGVYSTAAFTNALIRRNIVSNRAAGVHAIEFTAAATGLFVDNRMYGDTLGTILDPGSLKCLGNLETDAIDQAGVDSPRTSAGGFPNDSITAAAIATGAIDADAIANGAIDAGAFAAGAIDAAAIANGAIDAATFAAGAIDAASIANGAIDAATFAAGAIDAAAIANGAIDAATFAAGAIDAAAIAADAITAAKIADSAIDFATFAADVKTGAGLKANVESVSADAITAAAIAAGAIDAATFAAGAIDAAAIANGAIDAATFAAGAIDAAAIANGAIDAATFAAGAIDAAAIANGAIDAATFAAGAIDAAAIANSAIDANTFAAGAIDAAAIADNAIDAGALALSVGEKTTEGVIVTRATAALPQTAAVNIFTITGLVLVKRIVGYVTVQIGAVANATKLVAKSTGAGADTDLCGTLDVTGDVVDSRYEITGTFANAMVQTIDVPLAKVQVTEIILPPGTIAVDCAGSDGGTGRVRWSVTYVPLESGAQIVAA